MKQQELLPQSLILETRGGVCRGILLAAALFIFLTLPWLISRPELFRQEGIFAAIAAEYTDNLWDPYEGITAKAHNVMLSDAWPLYPAVVSLFYRLMPMESALRLVSVLMLGVLSLLAGITAAIRSGKLAGVVAGVFCFSTVFTLSNGIWGGPETMAACFLFAAQLLFFHYGSRYADWNSAWISAAIFLSLGFLTAGPVVIIFFIFPLVFLRRPLSFAGKFRTPGFLAGVILLLIVVLAWALPIGLNWRQYAGNSGVEMVNVGGLFKDILLFPAKFIFRMLPWSLIIWMPFCVALQAISPVPVFSRYLRTLFFSMLALIWLMPGGSVYRLFFLLAPLAVLLGLNYELGIRRYSAVIRKVLVCCGVFFPVLIALILAVTFLPERFLPALDHPEGYFFRNSKGYLYLMLSALSALAVLWGFFSFGNKRFPVWVLIVLLALGIGVFNAAVHLPYRMMDRNWRNFGEDVRRVVPPAASEVYKYNIDGMYCGLFYCGIPVKELKSLSVLDKLGDTVYLISSEVPVYPDRVWTPLLPEGYTCRGVEVSVWRGIRRSDAEEENSDEQL
ncbi:MAG: hypothetical protein IKC82_00895 [Lentisphaeria bacterium]|nr:hypothetical protein [Lentisphaeria bacterium]